jgi:trans-aconitate methyltransferase
MADSDKAWARLGRIDPYLNTVRSLDPFKLDPDLPRDANFYFASGERYVVELFAAITRHVAPGFEPRAAVDFGCSVGRVTLALARRCASVIGLDVSRDALAEAERNAARARIFNARWLPSDDRLSQVTEPVDLFHSYNVLQHLPVPRGLCVVRRALTRLAPGGVLAVHVPYADRASWLRRRINWAQARIPAAASLANVTRGRPFNYPHMLMNAYDLNVLLSILAERGCRDAHVKFVDQGRYPGVIVMARAP